MPILYKCVTAVLALTGNISLLITGEMNPVMSISGIAVIPGYYRFLKGGEHAPGWAVGMLSALTFLVFLFDSVFISGDIFLAVAHLTVTFQAIKSFDLKEPWDHLQVYFMSLLQLIMASEFTRSITFGFIFIFFMLMLVTAMVLSHFLKEGAVGKVSIVRPVAAISLLTLSVTVVLFMSLPRTARRFVGKSYQNRIQTVGFSEKVDFGSFGDVKLDPTVVMRIETDRNIPLPNYWRGLTLDYFNGFSWQSKMTSSLRMQKRGDEFVLSPYKKGAAVEQKIYLEPIDSNVLFALDTVAALKADVSFLTVDDAGGIYKPKRASLRTRYTAYSVMKRVPREAYKARYLQLPDGMERIRDLAEQISADAEADLQKAVSIEQYLKRNYVYSLTTIPPADETGPIEDFLFNTKKGFCEHYATSMAVMLRTIGIPSRIVNGFYGGERNEYGNYIIVRQSDAHSWVEVLIDGEWRRFDPTPAVFMPRQPVLTLILDSLKLNWSRYVIGFSYLDQIRIVEGLTNPLRRPLIPEIKIRAVLFFSLSLAVLAAVMLSFFFALRKLFFRRYGFVSRKYLEFRRLMKKKGLTVTPSMTSGEIRKRVANMQTIGDVEKFISLYEECRFGRREMKDRDRIAYVQLLKEIKKDKKS